MNRGSCPVGKAGGGALIYRDELDAARSRADALERENARLRRRKDRGAMLAIAGIVATAVVLIGLTEVRRGPEGDCVARSWSTEPVRFDAPEGVHRFALGGSAPEPRAARYGGVDPPPLAAPRSIDGGIAVGSARCLELRFDRPLDGARVDVTGYDAGRGRGLWRDRRVRGALVRIGLDPPLDSLDVTVHRHLLRAEPALVSARIGERR